MEESPDGVRNENMRISSACQALSCGAQRKIYSILRFFGCLAVAARFFCSIRRANWLKYGSVGPIIEKPSPFGGSHRSLDRSLTEFLPFAVIDGKDLVISILAVLL